MNDARRLLAGTVVALSVAACAGDRPVSPGDLASVSNSTAFARVGPPHTCCYNDGTILRTVVPPASLPNEGLDPLYAFTSGGAEGQLPVISVGPGDKGYHGGAWAFHSVTWNVTPYLITSDEQLFEAEARGDVTIMRTPANDFRCPIQA
jgi:hypothetical protein